MSLFDFAASPYAPAVVALHACACPGQSQVLAPGECCDLCGAPVADAHDEAECSEADATLHLAADNQAEATVLQLSAEYQFEDDHNDFNAFSMHDGSATLFGLPYAKAA